MDKTHPLLIIQILSFSVLNPWGPWFLLMLPVVRFRCVHVLVEDKLLDFKHVTYPEWSVVCVWGCEWDSTFGLFTRKLGGRRHAYSWLWFSSEKTSMSRQEVPDVCFVLFCLVSIVSGLMLTACLYNIESEKSTMFTGTYKHINNIVQLLLVRSLTLPYTEAGSQAYLQLVFNMQILVFYWEFQVFITRYQVDLYIVQLFSPW